MIINKDTPAEKSATTTIAHAIKDAQGELYIDIDRALSKFTDTTGLCVSDICWEVARAMDAYGYTTHIAYYDMRSELQSGVS